MTTPTVQSRRFARVEHPLPVRLRPLDETEAEELAKRLSCTPTYTERVRADAAGHPGTEVSWERAALSSVIEKLERLEQTIQRIAAALSVDLGDGENWISGVTSALSGSGVGLVVPCKLPQGTPVEIELTLVGETTATVRAVARIVSVVHPDGEALPVGRYHLGAGFEGINDADREAIVRYTFKLQRAKLRERA
ncbi:MAG: PilZ domain-containing protein [Acidobacteria bacterium]|nr:MAG: PilZ domain-containing protein [Acidobacteriota bacterium]